MLDANACIDIQRGRDSRIGERLLALKPGEARLSLIVYGELLVGVEKSRDRERALQALSDFTIGVPVEAAPVEIAQHYGAIRARLEREGRVIGQNDLWIAAHARAADLTLVTSNEREFRRIPDLRVENWAAEEA